MRIATRVMQAARTVVRASPMLQAILSPLHPRHRPRWLAERKAERERIAADRRRYEAECRRLRAYAERSDVTLRLFFADPRLPIEGEPAVWR